jgi:chitin synthase
MPRANVPGAYDDPVIPDNRSENNIRYGRIPQRVPRRYKTVKKVE